LTAPLVATAPRTDEREQILAAPPAGRAAMVARYLQRTINALLGHAASRPVATDRPLADLGIDSLLSIQLQARLAADLHVQLAIRDLLSVTIETLGETIAKSPGDRAIEDP
jgi:aryl carrier-like protein